MRKEKTERKTKMGAACSTPPTHEMGKEEFQGHDPPSEPSPPPHVSPTPHAILVHPPPVGTVEVFPSGPPPHTFQWGLEQGCEAKQEKGGTLLTHAKEGTYSLLVKDGDGAEMDVSFQVTPLPVPTLERYEVLSHCTSDHSRDGGVRAILSFPDGAFPDKEGWSLLWSCGVVTRGDTLSDVRPGSYSATLLVSKECSEAVEWSGGFLHLPSSPAVVEVR